MQTRQLRGY